MKRILLVLVLACAVVATTLIIQKTVSTAVEEKPSYEIVVLLDSSESMNWTDENRLCIEAAREFAYLYPSYADFKIDLIVYNSFVGLAYSDNVSNEMGMSRYEIALDNIRDNTLLINGRKFTCWRWQTCIGSALDLAQQLIDNSTAYKKAVMMFTDGVPEGDGEENLAYSVGSQLRSKDIPVFAVGLFSQEGTARQGAEDFLGKVTDNNYYIANNSSQLMSYFSQIYAKLLGNDVTKTTDIRVTQGVEHEYSFHTYGGVVREVNIVVTGESSIYDAYLVNNERTIQLDALKTSDRCKVNTSDKTTNIKLTNPIDGDWKLKFKSRDTGTVNIGEIHLHDVKVYNALVKEDKAVVGKEYNICASLLNNDANVRIPAGSSIYSDSICELIVTDGKETYKFSGALSSNKDGFDCKALFDKVGTYEYKMRIANDRVDIESDVMKVDVVAPLVKLSHEDNAVYGKNAELKVHIISPLDNSIIKCESLDATLIVTDKEGTKRVNAQIEDDKTEIELDTYGTKKVGIELQYRGEVLNGNEINIYVPAFSLQVSNPDNLTSALRGSGTKFLVECINHFTKSDTEVENITGILTVKCGTLEERYDFVAGKLIPLSPRFFGTCSIIATAEFDGMTITSNELSFTFTSSEIITSKALGPIKGQYKGEKLIFEYDLDTYFADSDSDKLQYSIQASPNDKSVTATVEGTKLVFTADGGSDGKLNITVTDSMGAELVYSIEYKITSLITILIVIGIIFVVIVLLCILAYYIIKKQKIIKIGFDIKIEYTDADGNESKAIYSIRPLTSAQSAKPKMNLTEILCNPRLAAATDDRVYDWLENFKTNHGSGIWLEGTPFKKGFTVRNTNRSKPAEPVKTYTGNVISIRIKNQDESIYKLFFGKPGKFNEEEN